MLRASLGTAAAGTLVRRYAAAGPADDAGAPSMTVSPQRILILPSVLQRLQADLRSHRELPLRVVATDYLAADHLVH
jgi:hypothetical protein